MIFLLAHSGGPTSVINASLLGIVEEARGLSGVNHLLGARLGIDGILAEDFVDLLAIDRAALSRLGDAPSSALGTSRRVVTDADLERVVEICGRRAVDVLLYTGGNGSMETADQIARIARGAGRPLRVIGVPKTIDNDLAGTDHAPGYGSAARFFAEAARDIGADNRALPGQVEILEVLGRNAGWIAAATSLASRGPDDAPHLVYLPERRLSIDRLCGDVQRVFDRLGRCAVAVCEGQLDEAGEPFGADVQISSRGSLARNLGHRLAQIVMAQTGLKARAEKPGLFGRVSRALRSPVDWQEARRCGAAAVRAAAEGQSGVMITIVRRPSPGYAIETGVVALERVAGAERLFPAEWIGADGCSVAPEFRDWAAPIVGGLEKDEFL